MLAVAVTGREDPQATLAHSEHRRVAQHLSVAIAERRVANLAGLEVAEVLREDVVSGAEGVRTLELPLPEGREIPDADVVADCVVLASRVPEVVRPEASLPLHELGAGHAEHIEEDVRGVPEPSATHTDTSPKRPASHTVPRRA